MIIRPISDLHLEFSALNSPETEADITLLAGDIFTKEKQLPPDLRDFFKSEIVIGIAGNHEFYGKKIDTFLPELYNIYDRHHGIFLENDYITIDNDLSYSINGTEQNGFRIIGSTLWTDFKLFAGDNIPLLKLQASKIVGNSIYDKGMNDFRLIREASRNYRRFRPIRASMIHSKSKEFIEKTLNMDFDGIKYVMTHHAPSALVLPDDKKEDVFSIAYASNMDDFIKEMKPDFWQFGHIHHPKNITIENTKIFSNPRGYIGKESYLNFDINKRIDIDIPLLSNNIRHV